MQIPIEVSARHLHISQTDLETLFGAGYQLQKKYDLKQPGEFASQETVKLSGPKGELTARILGPIRDLTQVEITYTDCKTLGIITPLRLSNDLTGTAGLKLIGTIGEIVIPEGVIISQRHIHINPEEATANNLKDGQIIQVKIFGARGGIFDNIIIRIKDNHRLVLHIDTDEANALGVNEENCNGELIIY